ncbi:hypothetical protein GGF32_005223 [Allomyces javanicus]|nr:hypothetical protein GGF32_005223 [Allomyces javanicus]
MDTSIFASLQRHGFRSLRLTDVTSTDDHAKIAALADYIAHAPRVVESYTNIVLLYGIPDYDDDFNGDFNFLGLDDAAQLNPLVAHMPRATRTLNVRFPIWDAAMGACLPLAAPLKELYFGCMPMAGVFDESIEISVAALAQIVPKLPATLTVLNLDEWPFGGTHVAGLLAQHMPPHLTLLAMTQCKLTDDDVALLLWPRGLHTLRVHGARITTGPVRLPARLKTLELNGCASLADENFAWVNELPRDLEVLDVRETRVGDGFATALLARMPMRDPTRNGGGLVVKIAETRISPMAEWRLRSKFWVHGNADV